MVVVTPHHFLSLSCVPVKTRLVEFHLCRRFVMFFFFFFFFFLWGVCCFPSGAPVDGERGLCFYFRFEKKKKKRHFSGRTFLFVPLPLFYSLLFFFLPSRNSQIAKNRWMYCSSPSAAAAVQRKIIDWWPPRLLGLLFFLFFQGSRGSISGWVRTGGYGPLFFSSSNIFRRGYLSSHFHDFLPFLFDDLLTQTLYKDSQITAATAPVRPNIHPALAKCQFKCPSSL